VVNTKAMSEGVSIVICCHNSATRLGDTLGFIARQRSRVTLAWEVLVVDNASTDETQETARVAATKLGIASHLRILYESNPGQTNARLKGIKESIYDLILFADDDNHLAQDYLMNIVTLMHEHPEVGIMGGWNKPKFPFQPGPWIADQYTALAIGKKSDADMFVTWVFGAGMVVRRKVFETLAERGIAPLISGRTGSYQGAGDDAELCALARFAGFRIYYTNQLTLDHAISGHRLSKRQFIKSNVGTIEPVVHLHLLDKLVADQSLDGSQLYAQYFRQVMRFFISSLPRSLFGSHRFFNFIILLQNTQVIWWLLTSRGKFNQMVTSIRRNLKGVDRKITATGYP
jgi:glycosyltransferase involved in cell wall biosynthesis